MQEMNRNNSPEKTPVADWSDLREPDNGTLSARENYLRLVQTQLPAFEPRQFARRAIDRRRNGKENPAVPVIEIKETSFQRSDVSAAPSLETATAAETVKPQPAKWQPFAGTVSRFLGWTTERVYKLMKLSEQPLAAMPVRLAPSIDQKKARFNGFSRASGQKAAEYVFKAVSKPETIAHYQRQAKDVLKLAFLRKSGAVAESFRAVGKNIMPESVRKWWAASDVTRRNWLENFVIGLGAAAMTDREAFDLVANYSESYIESLRGNVPVYPNMDQAMNELRFRMCCAERAFLNKEDAKLPELLLQVDYALKGVFSHIKPKN